MNARHGRQRDSEPALEHREKKQVQLDVVRSMTHFAMRRDEREERLKQVLVCGFVSMGEGDHGTTAVS